MNTTQTYGKRGEVHTSKSYDPVSKITRWRAYQTPVGGSRVLAYGLTARKAEDALQRKLAGPGTARAIVSDPRDLSVRQLLDGWIDYRVESNHLRPASVATYRYGASLINDELADVRLGDLLTSRVEAALNHLKDRPLSAAAVAKAKLVLSSAISWAGEDDPTLTYNPAAYRSQAVRGGPKHRKEARNPGEVDAIIAAMPEGWLRRLVTISVTVGLRQAEAIGLTEDELSGLTTSEARLTLRHQLQQLQGGRVRGHNLGASYSLTPCKTDEHDQPVGFDPQAFGPLAADAVRAELAERVPYQPVATDGPGLAGLIFLTAGGRPRSGYLVSHSFRKALKAAGLPPLRYHGLRGVYINLAAAGGVPLDRIAQLVHHSSSKTTEESYLQTTTEQQVADLATFPTLHV